MAQRQGALEFVNADVRDRAAIDAAFLTHRDAALILHLAGQVAVTTSVADPRLDFEINALGTLNVLEAVRRVGIQARPSSTPRPTRSMAR